MADIEFEFDPVKHARNVQERGIGFERMADMDSEAAITVEDTRKDYGERRLSVVGPIDGRLYVAVVTPRGDKLRVISLRRANKREERDYAEKRQSAR